MCEHTLWRESWGEAQGASGELPDPWEGEHEIEYWVWDGTRLVPASAEQLERIREDERTFTAMRRLWQHQQAERKATRRPLGDAVYARIVRLAERCLSALKSLRIFRPPREDVAALRTEREHSAEV